MKAPRPKRLGGLLRLAAGLALLTVLAWQIDWRAIVEAVLRTRWAIWALAALFYAAIQVAGSLRWQHLARPLGLICTTGQHARFYFIGMFFNLVLPTSFGGDVVRAWYLATSQHLGDQATSRRRALAAAFFSVFLDRASGLLVLLALACTAAALCPLPLPVWLTRSVWGLAACAVAGIGFLALLARFARRLPLPRALGNVVERVRSMLALYQRQPLLLLTTTLLALVVQAGNVVVVWMIGWAADMPVPAAYYWLLVPVTGLVTLLPISVGGMGVREAAMVVLLAPLGVPAAEAMGLSLLWFAAYIAISLIGVVFYLRGSSPRFEELVEHGPVGSDPDQGRAGQSAAAA